MDVIVAVLEMLPVCDTVVVAAGAFKGAEKLDDEDAGVFDESVDVVFDSVVEVLDAKNLPALATAADYLEPLFVPPNTPTPQSRPRTKIVNPRKPSKAQNQLGHLL